MTDLPNLQTVPSSSTDRPGDQEIGAVPPTAPRLAEADLPPRSSGRFQRLAPLVPYGTVLALTLLLLTWNLQLWRMDFMAAYSYGGDGMLHLMFSKAFVENGWYLQNPSLGAPFQAEMYEFPAADVLPGVIIKLMGVFTHDAALINNLFFFLTFPLASLCAYFACRRIGISAGPAMLASLLYAFLPYHFYRNTGHLYLTAYFVAPLAALAAWWVAAGGFYDPRRPGWRWGRFLLAVGLCAVASTAGIYYPFFAGIFLAVASLLALCGRRDWPHFLAGGALTAILIAGMLACLYPTLRYLHTHPGVNPVSQRSPGDAETYGLKITQLVLPIDEHRLRGFADKKAIYNVAAPLVNENDHSALGAVGGAGFVLLLGWLLLRPMRGQARAAAGLPDDGQAGEGGAEAALLDPRRLLDVFGVFTGAAIFFGSIGGVASLFALFITPQVRSVNRISVYLAFFALAAVAACLDWWFGRGASGHPRRARGLGWVGLGGLLAVGVLDQTHPVDPAYYKRMHREYRAEREFFGKVQFAAPPGGMIFQLPYASFPENGLVEKMEDYSHFRGYVHTSGLRWSYGAMRDSAGDVWQRQTAALPPAEMLHRLALAGFSGVFLERDGYPDDGAAMEAALREKLGPPVALRLRRLYFNLADFAHALRAAMTPEEWQHKQVEVLYPPFVSFLAGFSGPESATGRTWRWCSQTGEIRINNPLKITRRVTLQMQVNAARPEPAHLAVSGAAGAQTLAIDGTLQPLVLPVELPPGDSVIRFQCDAQPIDAPGDPRVIVWSLTDFRLDDGATP